MVKYLQKKQKDLSLDPEYHVKARSVQPSFQILGQKAPGDSRAMQLSQSGEF